MSETFPTQSADSGLRWPAIGGILGGLLVCYYLIPLVGLVLAGSPATILARATTPRVLTAATHSLLTATASTLVAAVFGLPLSYWLARTESRWQTPVTAVVVLPLVLPPVVSGMLLLSVIGPDALGGLAEPYGVELTRSLVGVVVAQTFVASPFLVVTASAAFESVDAHLEEAARTLGDDHRRTLRRVTIPLAKPGILAGLTLTFARAMGEFGATLMVAYYPRTLPVEIWATFLTDGIDAAFVVAVVLLVVSLVALAVLTALGETPWRS